MLPSASALGGTVDTHYLRFLFTYANHVQAHESARESHLDRIADPFILDHQ